MFFIVFKSFRLSLFSIIVSKITPPDLEYVKNNQWLYESGFKIGKGDFVEFIEGDPLFQLKGDTIYFNNKPQAIVVKTNQYLYQMIVSSIDGKYKGEYANTDEFSK
jgi:hypothetical protein